MICGLFSSFDPTILTSFNKVKWIFLMFLLPIPLIVGFKGMGMYFQSFIVWMVSVVYSSNKNYKSPLMIMSISLFLMILSINLMGMIPYSFSNTSHLSINLSISLTLWSSVIIYSVFFSIKDLISHMVPYGSPLPLWPLLVVVETTSMMIRPWTLSIRLMANVMSGHLIMSLMGSGMSKIIFIFLPSIVIMSGFISFEMCVSIIQSYVFTSLMVMYWSESYKS